MALKATKEQVMNAISSLGFEVFKNGSFHWNSSNTPDMKINEKVLFIVGLPVLLIITQKIMGIL